MILENLQKGKRENDKIIKLFECLLQLKII